LLGVLIGGLGVAGWNHFHPAAAARDDFADAMAPESRAAATAGLPVKRARFECDGRTRCSQMTSCEEAKFFLENCPGVKMDGEGDGIPCEGQWCGHH
jgi:hypothetical protein